MKTRYYFLLLIALITSVATAQNNQVLYFMDLPQNHLLNPALRPSNSIYIGLPVISGININMNNNVFNYSDFLQMQEPDLIWYSETGRTRIKSK